MIDDAKTFHIESVYKTAFYKDIYLNSIYMNGRENAVHAIDNS
jgi:hypothetical protein